MPETNQEPILFALKRIKDFSFFVNESLYINDPGKLIKVEFQPKLGVNPIMNIVDLTFRVYYHYDSSPMTDVLSEIQVQNLFEIPDLKKYLDHQNLLILPGGLITAMVTLSLSHTRALFAKSLSGTSFQDVLMPILNGEEVARQLFPNMFDGKESNFKKAAAIGAIRE